MSRHLSQSFKRRVMGGEGRVTDALEASQQSMTNQQSGSSKSAKKNHDVGRISMRGIPHQDLNAVSHIASTRKQQRTNRYNSNGSNNDENNKINNADSVQRSQHVHSNSVGPRTKNVRYQSFHNNAYYSISQSSTQDSPHDTRPHQCAYVPFREY